MCSVVSAEIKQHIDARARELFGIDRITQNHWTTVDDRLQALVGYAVENVVERKMREYLQEYKTSWIAEIRAAARREMDRQIEVEIQKGIAQRLEAARKL